MNKAIKIFLLTSFIIHLGLSALALNLNDHRIAVLVNDQLITSYDIIQRMKMNAILARINITPENNNQLANSSAEELIREKLKDEKLKEYEIYVNDEEYLEYEEIFYKRLPFNKNELTEIFEANNINYWEFKDYVKGQISWQKFISSIYFRLTSASEIEISEVMDKDPGITIENATNIIIQKQLDLKSSKMIRDMVNEATIEYK